MKKWVVGVWESHPVACAVVLTGVALVILVLTVPIPSPIFAYGGVMERGDAAGEGAGATAVAETLEQNARVAFLGSAPSVQLTMNRWVASDGTLIAILAEARIGDWEGYGEAYTPAVCRL